MKYFFTSILVIIVSMICFINPSNVFANYETENYARITKENTFLFKTPSDEMSIENVLFKLPTTYFVLIEQELDDFCFVKYQELNGYVKTENLTKVYETPTNPFPKDITFSLNKSAFAIVRDTPSVDGNIVGSLTNSDAPNYFGSAFGDEAIKNLGNEWYFISYENEENLNYGYVYAPLTENLSEIEENTEDLPTIPPQASSNSIISDDLASPNNLFLIGILCFVALLLFFITFLPFFISKKKHKVLNNNPNLTQTKE